MGHKEEALKGRPKNQKPQLGGWRGPRKEDLTQQNKTQSLKESPKEAHCSGGAESGCRQCWSLGSGGWHVDLEAVELHEMLMWNVRRSVRQLRDLLRGCRLGEVVSQRRDMQTPQPGDMDSQRGRG